MFSSNFECWLLFPKGMFDQNTKQSEGQVSVRRCAGIFFCRRITWTDMFVQSVDFGWLWAALATLRWNNFDFAIILVCLAIHWVCFGMTGYALDCISGITPWVVFAAWIVQRIKTFPSFTASIHGIAAARTACHQVKGCFMLPILFMTYPMDLLNLFSKIFKVSCSRCWYLYVCQCVRFI